MFVIRTYVDDKQDFVRVSTLRIDSVTREQDIHQAILLASSTGCLRLRVLVLAKGNWKQQSEESRQKFATCQIASYFPQSCPNSVRESLRKFPGRLAREGYQHRRIDSARSARWRGWGRVTKLFNKVTSSWDLYFQNAFRAFLPLFSVTLRTNREHSFLFRFNNNYS